MTKREHAQALRDDAAMHYNCCQAVLIPFAEELGMDHETAYRLAAHFGGGMRRQATCGAVTGALMALGMAGADNNAALDLMRRFREHNQALDCAALLRLAEERGEERKCHCDRMVYEAVELLEEQLERK